MNVHAAALAKAHRFDEATSAFASDVIDDLSQQPKRLSPKYFYDVTGSELFEQITLPAGVSSDPDRAPDPARSRRGYRRSSRRRGAGGIRRRRHHQGALLLDECAFSAYVPVDISGDFLEAQADALRQDFPDLDVYPVTADFTAPFALPDAVKAMPKVGFFPGRRWAISNRTRPAASCAARATFWDRCADGDRRRSRKGRARAVSRPTTMPPASPRASISMCWSASTANSAAISIPPASSIARSTIATGTASKCT